MYFYDIDTAYADYLRTIDHQVPHIGYSTHNKFLCGIVMSVNGCDYYAPISHNTNKQRTNMIILSKRGVPLSSIKFCFMIPVAHGVVKAMDFNAIGKTNAQYANLLIEEWDFCNKNQNAIHKKAHDIYAIGCNKNHRLNYTCCDFKALELASKLYK